MDGVVHGACTAWCAQVWALIILVLDELPVKLSGDDELLWRMMYRRCGMTRRECQHVSIRETAQLPSEQDTEQQVQLLVQQLQQSQRLVRVAAVKAQQQYSKSMLLFFRYAHCGVYDSPSDAKGIW